jgi:hypothetical protein
MLTFWGASKFIQQDVEILKIGQIVPTSRPAQSTAMTGNS